MVLRGDELVAIVDKEDNVLYVAKRWIADRDRLRMRTARAIVFDLDMNIWIHRRALKKPVNGGDLDVGIGETPYVNLVNGAYEHESYVHAAKRGISEEMFNGSVSIDDVVVAHVAKLPPIEISNSPRIYDVFAFCYYPSLYGPITLEKEEIEPGSDRFLSAPALKGLFGKEKFMGIAPVIANLARYIIRNPGVMLNPDAVPINLEEVCTA